MMFTKCQTNKIKTKITKKIIKLFLENLTDKKIKTKKNSKIKKDNAKKRNKFPKGFQKNKIQFTKIFSKIQNTTTKKTDTYLQEI